MRMHMYTWTSQQCAQNVHDAGASANVDPFSVGFLSSVASGRVQGSGSPRAAAGPRAIGTEGIAPAKVGTRELGEQLVVRLEKVGEARLGRMELVLVLTVVGGHVHRAIAGRVEIARPVLLRALSDGLVVEAEAREGCELRDDLGGAGRVQVLVPNDMELLRREDALCHEQAGRIQAVAHILHRLCPKALSDI